MTERTDFRDYTKTLYDIISSPAGERDWDRERTMFHPDARLVRTGLNPDGTPFALAMSVDEYIENAETLLADVSFTETELSHAATIFGNVAQVSSVYEFTWQSGSEVREGRGVNFFTLIYDGDQWLFMSIVWDNERDGEKLPESLY